MTKILIVDDDQNQRIILQRILKKENYDCMTASSGQQALELLEKNLFDLVISDMRMGKISGRDLLKSIQKKVAQTTRFNSDCLRRITRCDSIGYP